MSKYRPKKLNEIANKSIVNALTIKYAHRGTDRIFVCGNCESVQVADVQYSKYSKPKEIIRCTICGEEIDWDGYSTLYKECPQCKSGSYGIIDQYCRYCSPKVELVVSEPRKW